MIRIATEADVPEILAIYAPYILNTTYTFEYEIPTQEAFLARFRSITTQFPWLVWEENGQILGYAYGSAPFDRAAYAWCSEISIYLRSEARRKGIGSALYAAVEQLLRLQGYTLVYALITSENTASLRFHEHAGYTFRVDFPRCGYKFGRWLGVIWMEKTLNFVENPSTSPFSWLSIVENDRKLCDILAKMSLS